MGFLTLGVEPSSICRLKSIIGVLKEWKESLIAQTVMYGASGLSCMN